MYQCRCGHTFMTPSEQSDDINDETEYYCRLCEGTDFWEIKPEKSPYERLQKCDTLIAINEDYLHNWCPNKFSDKQIYRLRIQRLHRIRESILH